MRVMRLRPGVALFLALFVVESVTVIGLAAWLLL